MISWLSSIFGGSSNAKKVVDTAADGISNGLDKLILTDEEKLDYSQKGYELYLKFLEMAQDENSIRSVTRRVIAWAIVLTVLASFWASIVFAALGYDAIVQRIIDIVEAYSLGWSFIAVITFYFGVHLLRAKRKE